MRGERQGTGVSEDDSGEAGRGAGHREVCEPHTGACVYPRGNEEPVKGAKGFKQESHMVEHVF